MDANEQREHLNLDFRLQLNTKCVKSKAKNPKLKEDCSI